MVQILLRRKFENLVADLETYRLELLSNLVARSHNLAEVVVCHAVKILNSLLPLLSEGFEHEIWNSDVGAASVDDGSVLFLLSEFLTLLESIEHVLALECPLIH